MGQWVVTVAGIAILTVLCDIILPDGQTRKYIKTVIGIVVTLVMIQPIASFIGDSFAVGSNLSTDSSNVQIQQSYLDMIDDKQIQSSISTVQDILNARDVDVKFLNVDKYDKTILLQCNSSYSSESKSIIDKVFDTYFADYKITIVWK